MGRNDSSCRDSHKTTGYPLTLRECSFTVVRGPLSGSQAPHRLALLLICFTLQGGRTTYPASPQGNSQLSRNEVTINKLHYCTMITTVTKYKCAKGAATRIQDSQRGRNTNSHLRWDQESINKCSSKFQPIPNSSCKVTRLLQFEVLH